MSTFDPSTKAPTNTTNKRFYQIKKSVILQINSALGKAPQDNKPRISVSSPTFPIDIINITK